MNKKLLDNYDKMVVKEKVAVIHCAFGDTPHTVAFVHVDKGLLDGCRSTSVGDQVLVGNTKYMCSPYGWELVT